jgi:hypothetical protein
MASQSFSAAEFVYSSDVVIQTVSPDDLFNRGLNHEVAAASHQQAAPAASRLAHHFTNPPLPLLPYKTPSHLTKSSTTG